jgi:4-hydroxybenzoyl-CoA thioesterase/acyl-CoA thioester hydrolase
VAFEEGVDEGEGRAPAPVSEFRTRRRIEFSDTDMAGIIHFSRYFVFMESAEHLFWNHLGTSVHTAVEGKKIGWPRVAASCDFVRPVRFEDEVDIIVRVAAKGRKSLTLDYLFEHQGVVVARGQMTTVCCELTDKGPRGIAIPAALSARIEPFPATGDVTP